MTTLKRLLEKVTRLPHGCWIWTGKYRKGFPVYSEQRTNRVVSGLSVRARIWDLTQEEPRRSRHVRMHCSTPRCVNPTHMVLASWGPKHITKPKPDRNEEDVATRECLCCDKQFTSEWVGRRLCPSCRSHANDNSHAEGMPS